MSWDGTGSNVIDFRNGEFVVNHANGEVTIGAEPTITQRSIRIGCTMATKRALQELYKRAFGEKDVRARQE